MRIEQAALSRLRGQARLAFRGAGSTLVPTATLRIERLQMPAAYTSFLQIALAATDLGALRTSGTLTGLIEVRDDALSSIQLDLDGLDLVDTRGKFMLRDLRGRVHWTPAGAPAPPDSQLSWREGGAYGLSGGAAQIDFRTQGLAFALRKPTRVPVFDGAIAIRALTIDAIGTPKLALTFDGDIEPISMPRFASAFGWPEFAGQLAGRVPRVEFKDNVLTFGGDVEAQVFGGRIVASGLRLQDPLGSWPKLFADVRIERLDLALVTNTFSIGSITGRLDGALKGLELFNWSPVAFDAFLQTPAGDRSSHRISARAVGNLANIGGGGGGVRTALESGVFRMFDEYNYDRIGIRCRLANDVCTMSGIEPAGIGYFILKGRGVPHINIVGNAGRVNWPQLVSQIATQMRGEGKLRIE